MSSIRPISDPLIGRAQELATALSAVQHDEVGVHIHVSGPAGIGKSAFVSELLRRVADRYALQIVLAGQPSGERDDDAAPLLRSAVQALAASTGRPAHVDDGASVTRLLQQYRALQANLRVIIVVDELRSPRQAAPLTRVSAGNAIVTAGRFPWPGDGATDVALDPLTHDESITLLRRFAGEGPSDEKVFGELARRMGGHPLALRLTADLVRREGGDEALKSLLSEQSRQRAAHDRGSTLRSALRRAYDALPDDARRGFRLLGLLGRVTPSTLATLAGSSTEDAATALTTLERAGLVSVAGNHEYATAEAVAEFARERLNAEEPADALNAALSLPSGERPSPRAQTAKDRIALQEYALRGARERQERPAELRALVALGRLYLETGYPEDAVAAYESAYELAVELGLDGLGAIILEDVARVYMLLGRYSDSEAHLHRSLEIHMRRGDTRAAGGVWRALGALYGVSAAPDARTRAESALHRSLEIFKDLDDEAQQAQTLALLGQVLASTGRGSDAASAYRKALKLYKSVGDPYGEETVLEALGGLASDRQEWAAAREHFELALEVSREIGDVGLEPRLQLARGRVLRGAGEKEAATAALERSLALAARLGDKAIQARALALLGTLSADAHRYEVATSQLEEARGTLRELGDRAAEAEVLDVLGKVYLQRGQVDEGHVATEMSRAIRRELGVSKIQ